VLWFAASSAREQAMSDEYDDQPRRSKKKSKSGKKKKKSAKSPSMVVPAIIGASVLVLVMMGLGVWFLLGQGSPPAKPTEAAKDDGPGYTLPPEMLPPKEKVVTWSVTDDPLPKPTKEFKPISYEGKQLVAFPPLGGHHVVISTPPETGDIRVFRVLNVKTGEITGEFPQVYGQFRISDDGKRIAAVLPVRPPEGSPKNTPWPSVLRVMELESKKELWQTPLPANMQWFDFGKTGDVLLYVCGHQYGTNIQYVDLKESLPNPKPWPFVKNRGRESNNLTAVSPTRKYLAINGEYSVELFDLETTKVVGVLDAPGLVIRSVFSGDGKSLLVLTRQQTMERVDPQLVPLTWTTYALNDGKATRTVTASASMTPTNLKVIQGSDPNTIHFETALGLVHFDLEMGANFDNSMSSRPLLQFDVDRWVIADEQKKVIQLYDISMTAERKAKLAEAKRLLGERPALAKVDRSGSVNISATATSFGVPASPASKTNPAFTLADSPDTNLEFLDNRADNAAWSAVQVKMEELPRRRAALGWTKFDAATGKPTPAIPLWPCALEPGKTIPQFGFASLRMDANKASDRIALRDPRLLSRLDIWTDKGERITGFEPGANQEHIEWLGWADGDRLLVRTATGFSGWDGSQAKAVFEFAGAFDCVLIAPDRKWVAVSGEKGIDILETQTGKHLGRIERRSKHGNWTGLGLSADGKSLFAASSDSQAVKSNLPVGQVPTEFATWDLATGRQLNSLSVGGYFAVTPGTILHELNEKQVMIGNDVLDLEIQAITMSLTQSTMWGLFRTRYIDGRLWMPMGRIDPQNPSNVRLLLSKRWPDDVTSPLVLKPEEIVFRAGATVRVTADLSDGTRSQTAKDLFETGLRSAGYTVGNGGWTLRILGTQKASGEKLTAQLGGEIAVPYIAGTIELVAPTGEVLALPGFAGSFGIAKNKYITKSTPTGGGGSITYYDFGGSPSAIMGEEVWKEAMGDLTNKVRFPTVVVKQQGKLLALPVPVSFK
jgi:hypothetical protein